jgi:hypothetical protein
VTYGTDYMNLVIHLIVYSTTIIKSINVNISMLRRSKIVKNEHARYTLERFPIDFRALSIQKKSKIVKNERARYRSENRVFACCVVKCPKKVGHSL